MIRLEKYDLTFWQHNGKFSSSAAPDLAFSTLKAAALHALWVKGVAPVERRAIVKKFIEDGVI